MIPGGDTVELLAGGTVLVGFAVECIRRIARGVTHKVETTTAALVATIQSLAAEVGGMREDYKELRREVAGHGQDLAVLKRIPPARPRPRARKG